MDGYAAIRWPVGSLVLAAGLMFTSCVPAAAANERARDGKMVVMLVLTSGTITIHTIEMPSMDRCRQAAQSAVSAHCILAFKETPPVAPARPPARSPRPVVSTYN